ncbi:hypothetical protein [Algoriphagus pacificus]|uniref:Uncharacterized protein n=1 Tax=Algoriphagus pacificus TaxID=2811234 RepID=A0ABS3CHG4_9BACT|nr:hypothetical protein [Algoriphagus pacificus]MBN7816529.1 hypothetical protein [Algoriphagus pacificus]
MEKISLHELQFFLEEDLFLIPEDKQQLENSSSQVVQPSSKSTPAEVQESQEVYDSPIIEEEKIESEPIQVKGSFSNGLLIVHEEEELNAEVMDMLVKMINAVGKSMNEVGMVSSEILEGRSLEDFMALNAHTILKFGRISHPVNSVPAIPYEVYTDRETQYLFADSLSQIAEDKMMKRKLWNALQILFNINK